MERETAMQLDEEWIALMVRAKDMGLSIEDVRSFLKRAPHQMEALLVVGDVKEAESR